MSQSDSVGEFLELHRRHKTGELTETEAERWRTLKESLNQAPQPNDLTAPGPGSLEWDPDLEPVPTESLGRGDPP